jgi:AraC family transcriptional regulator
VLRYVSAGSRRYGEQPWHPHTRHSWEFQAVVEGRCAFWLPARRIVRERTLWLSAPECCHGWTAAPDSTCRICVLQFSDVPDLLRVLAGRQGFLEVPLDTPAIARLEVLAAQAAAIGRNDPLAGIRSDLILAELSLLVAGRLPAAQLGRFVAPADPERQVGDALAWFAANLASRPGVAEVARAMRISPAHLRRLFLRVRGTSPQAALAELRLRRADELMRDRALTLAEVARQSGFASGTALSHAYHAARGIPPGRSSGRRREPG